MMSQRAILPRRTPPSITIRRAANGFVVEVENDFDPHPYCVPNASLFQQFLEMGEMITDAFESASTEEMVASEDDEVREAHERFQKGVPIMRRVMANVAEKIAAAMAPDFAPPSSAGIESGVYVFTSESDLVRFLGNVLNFTSADETAIG